MPDITMCMGYDCPKKELCYRYKAKPFEYGQSYFTEKPFDGVNQIECEYFWPLKTHLEKKE